VVGFLFLGACIAYGVYVGIAGFPGEGSTILVDVEIKQTPGYMFLLGLLGGLVTFGGAYTAVPFVQQFAVNQGMWLTTGQFLDGLALASIIPAPLVSFVVFVGYLGLPGMRVLGAFLMFLGMMIPAFSFTLIGHSLMEKVVHLSLVAYFLDGVTASVIGLVLLTALQIIKDTVTSHLSLFIFFTAMWAQLTFKHPMVPLIIVFLAAVAGQVLLIKD
jgi:chromate transporter